MGKPHFTIIIVVFNGEKTLQHAIDSVLGQTYQDFELLIIDGASTDNTLGIIKANQQKDKRIRFVSENDNGIYDAMNKAIGIALGEWLYFLGCDDTIYEPGTLQKVSDSIALGDCEMFYGNVILLPGKTKYDGLFTYEKLLNKNISQQAIFYSEDFLKTMGGFNEEFPICADWDFNLRCFERDDKKAIYQDLNIAFFSGGGVSRHMDKNFFEKSLMPRFTLMIIKKPGFIKNIRRYDGYWRLLRNTDVRKEEELKKLFPGKDLPAPAKKLIQFQSHVPVKILKVGFFSKIFMGISYLKYRIFN